MNEPLRLGTRGSRLALTQSQQVADSLTAATGLPVELVVISTRGDRIQDRPLPEIGGKGLFTLELEQALRDGRIDLAVHSLKDLPTEDPDGLMLGGIPRREDPRDALVGRSLEDLKDAATVATGSLRRGAQLKVYRPDLRIVDIRGNVPTRLNKLDSGVCDSTVLAMAGLNRLGIERTDVPPLEVGTMVPAVGQGALGVQTRRDDMRVLEALGSIEHDETRTAVEAERVFLATYGGGCNVPAGCHVRKAGGTFEIIAAVEQIGGVVRFEALGDDPIVLAHQAVAELT